jgi:hypothetical protein
VTALRPAPRWLLPGLVAAAGLPLLVAALSQRSAGWHPVFDLAMTELRVRDVGGPDTPLIGLQGRIGPDGSHPGPLSFYLLAPVYRLLGSSAFALQVSTAVLHLAAVAVALGVAARRRHPWALLGVAAVILLLMLGYGLAPLTEPWNPYLPMLWFVAFLVSAWAVVDDDLPMLVPLVVAASVCAQTHVPYLAVTVGVGSGAVAVALLCRWRRGQDLGGQWLLIAVGVGVLLWTPPLIDEVVNEPGNLTKIVDNLGTPSDEPIGLSEARTFVLERMDLWQLVVVEPRHPGTYIRVLTGPGPDAARGAIAVGIWVLSAGASVVLRHRRLLALHAIVGGSLVVAWVAISRITGVPWPYLMSWAFGIGGLMLLAVGATAAVLARRWVPSLQDPGTASRLTMAGLAVVALLSIRLLVLAPDARPEQSGETALLGRLVDPTVDALEDEVGAATGRDGTYQVVWYDATHGGAVGIGMVNELVRRGFDVGVEDRERVRIGPHRVIDAAEASAQVVVANGGWIEEVAARDGAVQVALDDPRTAADKAELAELRRAAADALEASGRADLVERLDRDLFDVALNQGIETEAAVLVGRMIEIGLPTAVFVVPGGAAS